MLGVSASADRDAIKSAFRSKAKKLHPDINPSPIAAKQFQRLSEAYEILSDPARRISYDESSPAAKAKSKSKGKTDNKSEPPGRRPKPRHTGRYTSYGSDQSQPKTSARSEPRSASDVNAAKKNKATDAKTQKSKEDTLKPEPCQCGKVTAQPRYVVFDIVWGRGSTLKRTAVSGVFCRSCADKAALRASLITWITGWWAWPTGPRETVKALLNNVRGGRKPADRNAQLLVRQAKAFRSNGDHALAHSIAKQALVYARTKELRRDVDGLLLSLSDHTAKHLKTRWETYGWAPIAQLLPLIILLVWASLSWTMSTPVSLTEWARQQVELFIGSDGGFSLTEGSAAEVVTDALNVRTGPGSKYQVVVTLAKGDVVQISEFAPSMDWARVNTQGNESGFVLLRALAPLPE